MIRDTVLMVVAAFGLSLGIHLAGVSALWTDAPIEIEGGAPAQAASLGNSFQDVAQGSLVAEVVENSAVTIAVTEEIKPIDPTPAEAAAPLSKATRAAPSQPIQSVGHAGLLTPIKASAVDPSETKTVAASAAPVILPSEGGAVVDLVAAPQTLIVPGTVVPSETVNPVAERAVAAKPIEAQIGEAAQAPQIDVIEALPENTEVLQSSLRPKLRPNRPQPRQEVAAKPKAAKPAQVRQTARAQGTDKPEQRRGTAQGTSASPQTGTKSQNERAASQAGNAAASNYPGHVMRKISRQRRPRVSGGEAVIAFRVASNGGVASIRVASSSGNAKLDQAALALVRKAAPFKKPPPGAKTNFSIKIKGR